ncbi:NADH:flavin oxidoreductase [Terrarubrum flagellatum]|uniref:NADH:flavin oxidoreductase n=1 Tax=Terrirubrum flagellatum TaxID=2895980 RepID=UPI003144E447
MKSQEIASAEAPSALDALFEPAEIAGLSLQSRIAMAPMSRYLCPDGAPHATVADYYARRAANGVGLIISEGTYISHPSAPSYEGVPYFAGETTLSGWSDVVRAVHAAGGLFFPQLWHTGSFRRRGMAPDPDVPGFGPSENANAFTGLPDVTHAMTEKEIAEVIGSYAQAAADAKHMGCDGVEIHGAHGYLIDEFFWAVTNRRTDRYGGDRRARTRFAVEIVSAMRARVGAYFPISFRFSQWKQQDYAAKLADTPRELADVLEPLRDAGVSLFHCSTRRAWEPGFPDEGARTLAGWTKLLTGAPVIAVGSVGLDRPGLRAAEPASVAPVAEAFARGEFDLLAVGRALLADPEWVRKARDGRFSECAAYTKDLLPTLW